MTTLNKPGLANPENWALGLAHLQLPGGTPRAPQHLAPQLFFLSPPQGTPGPIGVPGPAGPKGERVSRVGWEPRWQEGAFQATPPQPLHPGCNGVTTTAPGGSALIPSLVHHSCSLSSSLWEPGGPGRGGALRVPQVDRDEVEASSTSVSNHLSPVVQSGKAPGDVMTTHAKAS